MSEGGPSCEAPGFRHTPVMPGEVLAALRLQPGDRFVDGTLGGAGHAGVLLTAASPGGWLYGFDRDAAALEAAGRRLERWSGSLELRQADFATMAEFVPAGSCAGVLLDLGVSSPQLDEAGRGFSLQHDGPLDMRMDRRSGPTAAELVNTLPAEELARIFWEYGDESDSRRIARAIVNERLGRCFERTLQLAALIERLAPRRGQRIHPATRVFQALRIAVNDELGSLRRGLAAALQVLRPGGRLAVISFHSGEDRVVKEFGRAHARDYEFDGPVDDPELRRPKRPELLLVTRRPLVAGPDEIAENPRSRSAKLRVMERL